MYYSYVEIEYVATSFSPARTDLALKLLKGAWLIQIGYTPVTMVTSAKDALTAVHLANASLVMLLFAHPEICLNLSHDGVPIVSPAPFTQSHHDQLNNRWEFTTIAEHLRSYRSPLPPIKSGGVCNVMMKVMKLTHGKFIKGPNWTEWQDLEYLQLHRACLGDLILSMITWLFSIKCRPTTLKPLIIARRPAVSVMAPPALARQSSLTRHMPTVSTRQVKDVLRYYCRRKPTGVRCRRLKRICQGSPTKTRILYLSRPHIPQMVGLLPSATVIELWQSNTSALCNAGASRVTPPLGEAR
jgi:hypothetical protein